MPSDSSAPPSFLSPLDVAPAARAVLPEENRATPVIVDYWRLIRRERWKLVIPVVVFAVGAFLISLRMVPIYEATSTLMFENTKGPVSIQDVGGGIANVSVEEGLAEFLQTSDVALRVIRQLDLTKRPEFVDEGNVRKEGTVFSTGHGEPATGLRANKMEERALTYFHDHLKVSRTHQNPLVKISFQSQDPAVAAAIVNEVPAAFIRADMDARYAATREADQWLNERLGQLKSALDLSEQRLAEYRNEHGIVSRDSDEASDRQISMLNQRLIDARARLSAAQDAQRQASSPDIGRVMGTPAIAGNPAVARAREAQSAAQARMAEVRSQLGEAHPQFQRAQSELQQAQEDLNARVAAARGEIAGELAAARAHERQLQDSLARARQAVRDLGSKEIVARQLEQDVVTNRQIYQTFLARVKEVTAAGDFQRPAARLIDAAQVPTKPVKPRRTMMTLIGAMLGMMLGLFGIVILDQLRDTLRRTDDVEGRLGRPFIGGIPRVRGAEKGSLGRMQVLKPESLFAEAIRTVATAVTLAGLERNMNVVAVTSAQEGEGKTTVACNLALALSSTRRVLLIDGDMRRPAVSLALGLPGGRPGLAQLLAGRARLEDCVLSVPDSRLKVIGAGRSMGNALDLLMHAGYDELISTLQLEYDLIVIDCPPVQLVSDALILGRSASSLIFVSRSDSTPLKVIRRALHRIDRAGISLLGVVLNAHDYEQADRFYGEQSGYARYGYGASYGAVDDGRQRKRSRERSGEKTREMRTTTVRT